MQEYRNHYGDDAITKKDIFYYIYGLFHHEGYKEKFANSLSRELPRIPMAPGFARFCEAGQALAWLHLNYETCPRYPLGRPGFRPSSFRKLSFAKKKVTADGREKTVDDRKIIRADGTILFDNIPDISYAVNGRTPLEWVVDRYRVTTDRDSGIANDPCTGTDIISVIERAVYVGIESDRIIANLPKEFEPGAGWSPKGSGMDRFLPGAGRAQQSTL